MIKTCDELGKLIQEIAGEKAIESNGKEKCIKDFSYHEMKEQIFWFVAYLEANSVATSFSTKDIAGLFVNGLPKMSVKEVNDWLETLFDTDDFIDATVEELKQEEDKAMAKLRNWIRDHYGIEGQDEEVEDDE